MNRQEALYWCVEKYLQWPVGDTYYHAPAGWKWRRDLDQISLVEGSGVLTVINEKDWLEAKAAKESKSMSASNVARETDAIPECAKADLSAYEHEKWIPQVDEKCEIIFLDDSEPEWFEGYLICIVKGRCVFQFSDNMEILWPESIEYKFRPLSTQEEIEREECGKSLIKMINDNGGFVPDSMIGEVCDYIRSLKK